MGRGRRKRTANDDDDNGFGAWGGYMAAKKSKLMEQFAESTESETNKISNIFSGISIFVNGYTKPSAEELKSLMSLHGGVYHHYHIPTKTTHIIASNLPDTKIKQLGWKNKIVNPEWITDSINANKLLDYSNYLLYTNQNRLQPKLNFVKVTDCDITNKTELTSKNISSVDIKNSLEIINDYREPLSPDMFDSFEDNPNQTVNLENPKNNSKLNPEIINNESKISDKTSNLNETINKSGRTLSAKDPRFLSEFYNNSRLHLISTLGATFKQHICNLREQSDGKFPSRNKLREHIENINQYNDCDIFDEQDYDRPVIMHIDMDCFFVSVGLRSFPELRGQPVAVTHSKGGQEPSTRSGVNRQAEMDLYHQRLQDKLGEKLNQLGPGNMLTRLENVENMSMSEIASCSYEARKAGVKNGMFMGAALKLCPNLKTLPYDFEGYKEVATMLYNTIAEYTLDIEGVSCDEMFVDISKILKDTSATVDQWATYIRNIISEKTKCPCSTGFGANRLQARMATKKAKPNGQFYLQTESVEKYMSEINVRDLPGVGHSISLKLKTLNVNTCGDLQKLSLSELQAEFGAKFSENLYKHVRGIDDRPLVYEHERKSVSAEVNYGIRFKDKIESDKFFKQLCEEVHSRLIEIKMKGKSITLKLMVRSKNAPAESSKFMGHGVCDYVTKSNALSIPTNDVEVIKREIFNIVNKLNVPPSELRGIGIQISRLEKISKAPSNTILTKFLKATEKNRNIPNNNKINNFIVDSSSKSLEKNLETNIKENQNQPHTHLNCEISKSNRTAEVPRVSPIFNNLARVAISAGRGRITNEDISKTGKSRGRPKGTANKNNKKNNNLNNGSKLQNFFNQQGTQVSNEVLPIDLEVLSALPEDIQNEILQEYKLQKTVNGYIKKCDNQNTTTISSKKGSSPIKTTKVETVVQNQENLVVKDDSSQDSFTNTKQPMFLGMNLSEVRQSIREWVSSENVPEICDITMLGEYFKNLALDSNIENLFIMLKFIYNEISNQNKCIWHKGYFEIVKIAQKGMLKKYGNPLFVYKHFQCDNKCKMAE